MIDTDDPEEDVGTLQEARMLAPIVLTITIGIRTALRIHLTLEG